jgi:hypothetical protein
MEQAVYVHLCSAPAKLADVFSSIDDMLYGLSVPHARSMLVIVARRHHPLEVFS